MTVVEGLWVPARCCVDIAQPYAEVVSTNAAETLNAFAILALLVAVVAAAMLVVVTRFPGFNATPGRRWVLAMVWVMSALGSAVAAVPLGLWGIPVVATITLPVLWIFTRSKTRLFTHAAGFVEET